ncbi:hypothetical protein AVEN_146651-1 [Araneus ventricosus]|uniref:Uncharacterized protein n=1 Tax=Araneus ventricosus TaxID=182803 RepID=A0A4Y2IWX7_ARAVE|nr:hypothetical protein AVEN_85238-1 [Araneus ventricosus]GBM82317.1 hypothetical protein AVEN_146651-1 [Araneus ventricosus]
MVRKSKNNPTVEIDHWGLRCLIVGRMAVSVASGKKGRRSSTPSGTNKTGVLGIKKEESGEQAIRKSRTWFRLRQLTKELCDQLGLKVPN